LQLGLHSQCPRPMPMERGKRLAVISPYWVHKRATRVSIARRSKKFLWLARSNDPFAWPKNGGCRLSPGMSAALATLGSACGGSSLAIRLTTTNGTGTACWRFVA